MLNEIAISPKERDKMQPFCVGILQFATLIGIYEITVEQNELFGAFEQKARTVQI